MKISDICIGDSQINEYKLENGTLTMILQDYTESCYEIVLSNCSYISVIGSVGFSLSDAKFNRTKQGDVWMFSDEDGAVMEIHFDGYSMRQIK